MTVLRRIADPRLRAAWTGLAAAAALAAFIMTGAVLWFLHPWRFAGLVILAVMLLAIWHGTFRRHEGRHADKVTEERPRRELATIAPAPDTTAEFESMGRLRGTAGQRAGYWPTKAARCSSGTACGCPVGRCLDMPAGPAVIVTGPGSCTATHIPELPCPSCDYDSRPVVTVTDDPPRGKHERPRTYLVHSEPPPYCARCGSDEHWTDGHTGPDPLVTQMVADRAESRARHAIDASLRERGFKVYPGGEDDAVKSMFTRAMASAIAAVEAARKP